MIQVTLTLQYGPKTARPPRAWLIGGGDPGVWLEEIAQWEVPHSAVRLYPIPYSSDDRRCRGALAVVPDSHEPRVSGRCYPYGRVLDQLYLPVEARFEPDVSDADLRDLLTREYVFVWHPAAGLIAFEPGDAVRMSDLLRAGRVSAKAWNSAIPGLAVSRRLVSLAPEEALTLEELLEKSQDDIGSDSESLLDLPPSPQEPADGIFHGATRQGHRALAHMALWLARRFPATANQPTWVDRMEQWASRQLAHLRSGVEAARNKEIARLMQLLETDPDRGLRYALPLEGAAHRGLAWPSGRLAERNVDFNLNHLAGGYAADIWGVSNEYRFRLAVRYRELAIREQHLGRYRRAAYILAELLGDYDGAVNALVAGRHWREAATLYRKRLHRPVNAAHCLEQGGLWTEAISLYQELEMYEEAGVLCDKLELADDARQMYRKAVAARRDVGDAPAAARILEEKLRAPDEAIEELAAGWPDSPQAGDCLRGLFRLLARLGRHDSTRDWIARFQADRPPDRGRVQLVDILADAATDYPDRTVRDEAAGCTRTLVSRQLPGASASDSGRLVSAIRRLVPGDRLLSRDCHRYLRNQSAAKSAVASTTTHRDNEPRLVRTIQLARSIDWCNAMRCGRTIFAAGFRDDHLVLARCNWDGVVDRAIETWEVEPTQTVTPILLVANPQADTRLFVHVVNGRIQPTLRGFSATDQFPDEMLAGQFPGSRAGLLGATQSAHGTTWLLDRRHEHLTLTALGPDGQQLSSETIRFPRQGDEHVDPLRMTLLPPVPLHARGDRVYIGLGNRMITLRKGRDSDVTDFGDTIESIVGSPPNTRTRLALTFTRGGTVWWDDFSGTHSESFAANMRRPLACFTRGGHLIAASERGCEVFRTRNRRLELENEIRGNFERPIGVFPAPHADRFGIAKANGEILVYAISPRR